MSEPLLSARGLSRSFGELPVFAGVDLDVRDGEILAVLGRSGSGKSSLLRCLAGLLDPTAGTVTYRGAVLSGSNPGTATVFQNVALLPWQTVWQNVELGLRARRVPARVRAAAVRAAIGLIGLDGFESAYPRELSGGMRQRVGFARALVVEPDVLLMDEPFSALDVLTAENLRGELLELWASGEFPTRALVLVTHDLAEAVQLADRVLVLDSAPGGTVRAAFDVPLPRPRLTDDPAYRELVAAVYDAMTGRTNPRPDTAGDVPELARVAMPTVPVDGVVGLASLLLADGPTRLDRLAGHLGAGAADVLDALVLLGFAARDEHGAELTDAGVGFAAADGADARELFAAAALAVPLVRTIVAELRARQPLPADRILRLLSGWLTPAQATEQFEAAVDWGRYANLYRYDADHALLRPGATATLLDL
ncbi:ATP-binding cassette domain-containing protein [Actinocatenispora rupis]|nr:ATP-binding cassette domain-containing protein [Actinocatenispora rupis]